MSRTKKGSKGIGYEYWGKRPANDVGVGKKAKTITNRIERAKRKKELKKVPENLINE